MIFCNIRPVEVNNGRKAAILNFINLKFFKLHPLLKPHNLFYSNGLAILSGFMIFCKTFSWIYRCYKLGQSAGSTSRSRSKNLKRHN